MKKTIYIITIIICSLSRGQSDISNEKFLNWGDYYLMNKNYYKAIELYTKYESTLPFKNQLNLAKAYIKIGNMKKAEESFKLVVDSNKAEVVDYYVYADLLKSNPFKTGNTAFRLGIAKALVPFVFDYTHSLLSITGEFQTNQLMITLIGTLIGIALIGIAFTGYWFRPLMKYEQIIIGIGCLFFVAPGTGSMIIGLLIVLPMLFLQFYKKI